jgi:hypothetical protein
MNKRTPGRRHHSCTRNEYQAPIQVMTRRARRLCGSLCTLMIRSTLSPWVVCHSRGIAADLCLSSTRCVDPLKPIRIRVRSAELPRGSAMAEDRWSMSDDRWSIGYFTTRAITVMNHRKRIAEIEHRFSQFLRCAHYKRSYFIRLRYHWYMT